MRLRLRHVAGSLVLLVWLTSPALALEQDDLDSLSRHLGATAEAASKFGEVGETLTHISSGQFSGTGSQKRAMARRVDAAMQPWRNASAATKGSLPYKVAPPAFMVSDVATGIVAPMMEGDVRGALGSAVNIGVAPTVTGAGASLFGAIGTGTGAVVGSFIPVVGTAVGSMVGGAVGTVAGGYISAFAYDKYIKDLVGKAVEGGIAGVLDDTPLHQAMMARDTFLREQAADDLKAAWQDLRMVSASFNPEGTELMGGGAMPYIVAPKAPVPSPDAQQQAALPPPTVGDLLTGVKKIMLEGPTVCTIDNGLVNCTQPPANIGPAVRQISRSLSGIVTGNTLELTLRDVFEARDAKCTVTTVYQGQYQVVLEAGGRALGKQTVTMSVAGCAKPMKTTNHYSGVGTWRVLE